MFWMLIRNSSTGSRIIPYCFRKPANKAPQSKWDKVWFEWIDFTSRYGGRTSLRLGYFHTLLSFPTTRTIVSRCECVFVYYMVYENTIHVRIHKKYNQIEICWNNHQECMNLFTVFLEAISAKILEHHEANLEFNSRPQWSRQVVSTYFFGSGRYLRWIESPPIILSGCDWAPRNLNIFNKF